MLYIHTPDGPVSLRSLPLDASLAYAKNLLVQFNQLQDELRSVQLELVALGDRNLSVPSVPRELDVGHTVSDVHLAIIRLSIDIDYLNSDIAMHRDILRDIRRGTLVPFRRRATLRAWFAKLFPVAA